MTGKILRLIFPRGFGFLKGPEDEDKDLFFHCSGVEGSFEDLKVGDLVNYEVEEGEKGPRAVKVQKIAEKEEEKEGDDGE